MITVRESHTSDIAQILVKFGEKGDFLSKEAKRFIIINDKLHHVRGIVKKMKPVTDQTLGNIFKHFPNIQEEIIYTILFRIVLNRQGGESA